MNTYLSFVLGVQFFSICLIIYLYVIERKSIDYIEDLEERLQKAETSIFGNKKEKR
jgi:hypothetical protein